MLAPRADDDAGRGVDHMERGSRVGNGDVSEAVRGVEGHLSPPVLAEARMQPAEVRRVDVTLEGLQPVARALILQVTALGCGTSAQPSSGSDGGSALGPR